jgi:hypothetical protein
LLPIAVGGESDGPPWANTTRLPFQVFGKAAVM